MWNEVADAATPAEDEKLRPQLDSEGEREWLDKDKDGGPLALDDDEPADLSKAQDVRHGWLADLVGRIAFSNRLTRGEEVDDGNISGGNGDSGGDKAIVQPRMLANIRGYDVQRFVAQWLYEKNYDDLSVCEVIMNDSRFASLRPEVGRADVFWSHFAREGLLRTGLREKKVSVTDSARFIFDNRN